MAIYYGREAELPGTDREAQEISMLSLHLLQSALAPVNTRMWNAPPAVETLRGGRAHPSGHRARRAAPGNRNDTIVYRSSGINDKLAGRQVMADGGYRGNPEVIMPYHKPRDGSELPECKQDYDTSVALGGNTVVVAGDQTAAFVDPRIYVDGVRTGDEGQLRFVAGMRELSQAESPSRAQRTGCATHPTS